MSARIAHRGPDGLGLYLNHDTSPAARAPQCGLVHRRLAVIDPDERSLQPFDDGSNSNWIVYNGEIYNYRELREQLRPMMPRYQWRTESDTEVLLAAVKTWGVEALSRVNGMLALAVWDQENGSLFLARDRLGQKPLYWAAVEESGAPWTGFVSHENDDIRIEISAGAQCPAAIAFASELSALRVVPWFDPSIDYFALAEYLRWGYVPWPLTIYQGAAKLPPAGWMRLAVAGCDRGRYYDPPPPIPGGADDAATRTRTLVQQAVQRQLVSDVPLGCFLSGGIDSSITALAMTRASGRAGDVQTFTIGFDDAMYDESDYAQEVARKLGTKHHRFVATVDAASALPLLAGVFGEPFADSSAIPTHYLSRETRQHVKVALSGDGGDELFGGYDRYRAMRVAERIRRLPAALRDVIASRLWQKLPGRHPRGRLARIKRLLKSATLEPGLRYAAYVRIFDEPTLQPLLGVVGGLVETIDSVATFFEQFSGQRDVVQAAMAVDRLTYLPDDLLCKVDRASMLHALEVRSPFMDHELVDFAAGLSTDQLIRGGGKRLLREAFAADLPQDVFARRKMGFAVPIGKWLREGLRSMLHDLLSSSDSFVAQHMVPAAAAKLVEEHQTGKRDHSHRLYALLMLELWWRGNR